MKILLYIGIFVVTTVIVSLIGFIITKVKRNKRLDEV